MEQPTELPTIEVFSDVHCPWGYLAAFRLLHLQPEWSGRLRMAWRCLPLEVVNNRGTPKHTLDQEVPYLLQVEPDIPARAWRRPEWEYPVTALPAFEALKCAEAQGDDAALAYNWAVRRAFFAESRCTSLRHVLIDIARESGLDLAAFVSDFDSGRYKHLVLEESDQGWNALKVKGSPTLVLPNGEQRPYPATPELLWDAQEHVVGVKASEYPEGDPLDSYRAIFTEALA
ncbi:MAG TPA: DsbA family protein [Ktedonobacterales bacterium]|jgi:predicted DsbA family dithiol-disulfide isomerase